jgi:hypothetical protein
MARKPAKSGKKRIAPDSKTKRPKQELKTSDVEILSKGAVHVKRVVRHITFEVLRSFQKYDYVGPDISSDFLFASKISREIALLGEKVDGSETYLEGRMIDLGRTDEANPFGHVYRVLGRSIPFTSGELNYLVGRNVIRIWLV